MIVDLSKETRIVNLLGKVVGAEVSNLADEKLLSKESLGSAFILSIEKALSDVSEVSVKVEVDHAEMKVYARLSKRKMRNSFRHLKIQCTDDQLSSDTRDDSEEADGTSEQTDNVQMNMLNEEDISNAVSEQECEESEHLEYLCSYNLNNDLSTFSRSVIKKITEYFRGEIRILEKQREMEIFNSKKGEIVSGTVISFESGNCVINLGLGDGFLSKHEMMPNDFFSVGSQIKAYISDVRFNIDGYQILLSRTRPEFLIGVMCSMIPELENRSMTILKAVRDPGMRSKVAVYTESNMVDPVGCCIGRDGVRIKAVRAEMGNERIDVVLWDKDIAVFIANALHPIVVKKIIFEHEKSAEVIVSDDDFSKAKAHRHQQIRLASRLTGCILRLICESDDTERSARERSAAFDDFNIFGLNEFEIRMLLDHDISYIDDFAKASKDEIKDILGDHYNDDKIMLMIKKAQDIAYQRMQEAYTNANVDFVLSTMPYADQVPLEVLSENTISTLDDIAQLGVNKLSNIIGDYLDTDNVADNCQEIIDWAISKGGKLV
jgi:N utilization substance protein A